MERSRTFSGEPASHFHSALIQPLLYLLELRVQWLWQRTKRPFSLEQLPFCTVLWPWQAWLECTPQQTRDLLAELNEPAGWRLPSQHWHEQRGLAGPCLHPSTHCVQKCGTALPRVTEHDSSWWQTPVMILSGMLQSYRNSKVTLYLICHLWNIARLTSGFCVLLQSSSLKDPTHCGFVNWV